MRLTGRKVLVTGAGGFIGSHLTEALIKMGCKVKAFVHYNSLTRYGWLDYMSKDITSDIEIFSGDIRDPNGVRQAVSDCEVIFHLSSLIGIPYSYHSPDTYIDTNVKGALNILQAARDSGIEKIVHTSTSEIYGTAQFVPITEEHPVNPQSPYAASKASADFLALSFYRSFGVPVAVLRPFNTYGPRQSERAVIPTIINRLLSGKKTVKLGALHPTRDFTFVTDTAAGFIKCAESDNSAGKVINIGNGAEISIKDLFEKIKHLTGRDAEIETDCKRLRPEKSEVERLLADNSRASELIGWQPSVSLTEGLAKTIEWFSSTENPDFSRSDKYLI